VEGGYRVNAQKRFASGGPGGDIALTSAPYDDPRKVRSFSTFRCPMKAEGVPHQQRLGHARHASDWIQHDHFEDVFVPDAAIGSKRPRGQWHPSISVVCLVALPIVLSPYVGLAETAVRLAKEGARKRPGDSHLPYLLGEMENALVTAQMAYRETVGLATTTTTSRPPSRAPTRPDSQDHRSGGDSNAASARRSKRAEEPPFTENIQSRSSGATRKRYNFIPMPEKKQLLFHRSYCHGIAASLNPGLKSTLVGGLVPDGAGDGVGFSGNPARRARCGRSGQDGRCRGNPRRVGRDAVFPAVTLQGGTSAGRTTVLPRRKKSTDAAPVTETEQRARFDRVRLLGQGRWARSSSARDNDIRRTVAVKRVLGEAASNAALMRFADEVRIVGQLEHPGIVPIYDVGRDDTDRSTWS